MDDREPPAQPSRPATDVEILSDRLAVVTLRGEHDLSTKDEVGDALARACERPHVVVDLSECAFIDSTVVGLLFVAYKAQAERSRRLELVVPAETSNVSRLLRLTAVETVIPVHTSRPAALE